MQVHQGMQYGAPGSSMYQTPQYVPMPQHQQNEQLRQFWLQQHREIAEVGTDPAEFKNHQLPLARIKKVQHYYTLLEMPSASHLSSIAVLIGLEIFSAMPKHYPVITS